MIQNCCAAQPMHALINVTSQCVRACMRACMRTACVCVCVCVGGGGGEGRRGGGRRGLPRDFDLEGSLLVNHCFSSVKLLPKGCLFQYLGQRAIKNFSSLSFSLRICL